MQGHAVGAGFQLALACDLRVLADDAQLAMQEPSLGLVPDLGGTQPLVDLVGYCPRPRDLRHRPLGRRRTRRPRPAWPPSSYRRRSSTRPPATWPPPLLAAPAGAVRATKALLRGAADRTYDEQRAAERAAQAGRLRDLAGREAEWTSSLSDDQRAVQLAVREWVAAVVVPDALRNDREERFPQEALDGLQARPASSACRSPRRTAVAGADPLTYCLFIEELSRGDANVRSIMSVHLGLVAGSIDRWGTEEQKQQWLPRMATGEVLGCFGLTEPDHGSNPADLRATRRGAARWRLADQRPEGVHHQRLHRRCRAGDGPHRWARARRASRRSWCRPTAPASPRTRCTASSGCGPATPRSWCSTASRSDPRRCSAARAPG